MATQILKHEWEYIHDMWVPKYEFQSLRSLEDVWPEWACGLNGFLLVCVLQEKFCKPAWHRSVHSVLTEAGWHQKVVVLIERLAAKPQWNVSTALDFLIRSYGATYTLRSFAKFLEKGGGQNFESVILQSAHFRE